MGRELLGNGWRFPLEVDRDGQLLEAGDEQKVRQAIEMILRTAPGERPMRPDFGCGIHDLVFDTVGGDVIGKIVGSVTGALQTWEPRIDVLGVTAAEDAADPTRLLIEIDYRIRSTNSRFNLVFPFYVQ
jgi:phage baseplate assembly protein W